MPLPDESAAFEEDPYGDPVGAEPVDAQPERPQDPSASAVTEYAPYDPTAVDAEKPAPSALKDDEGNDLPSFDPRVTEDFEGLMFLGALSKTFTWLGHRFQIRTLTMAEEMAIPILTREFQDTPFAGMAVETVIGGLCIHEVDGKQLPMPVERGSDEYEWARQRVNYVKGRWYRPTFTKVYAEYLELEQRTEAVVQAMGKASAPQGSPTRRSVPFARPITSVC